jgi:hypothetical protein
MQKINRLGWAGGLCFKSFGWRVGIRVSKPEPEALERLTACLPPGWEPSEPPFVDMLFSLRVGGAGPRANVRNFHLLYAGLRQAARTMDTDELFDRLESEVQLFVAEHGKERIFVHAGVVGWKGQAILLPGRSYSGKSQLVAALLRAGATYYSDEYAVLDSNGHVHPYHRKLGLRQSDGPTQHRTVEELGGQRGTRPLPVGAVVVTRYHPEARWRPQRLTPGRALLELLDNTVPAMSRPQEAVTVLQQVVPRSLNFKGPRGEAEEIAGELLRAVKQ